MDGGKWGIRTPGSAFSHLQMCNHGGNQYCELNPCAEHYATGEQHNEKSGHTAHSHRPE